MKEQGIVIRFPTGEKDFPLPHRIHTVPGVKPDFQQMNICGAFLGGKEAGP
jgi:hypothetical protein